jgi:hypothetical protein
MHKLGAQFDRDGGDRFCKRKHPPADSLASFDDDDFAACTAQVPCGCKSRRAGADNDY